MHAEHSTHTHPFTYMSYMKSLVPNFPRFFFKAQTNTIHLPRIHKKNVVLVVVFQSFLYLTCACVYSNVILLQKNVFLYTICFFYCSFIPCLVYILSFVSIEHYFVRITICQFFMFRIYILRVYLSSYVLFLFVS